ncbi:MAG: hypothetical protein Q9184_005412 [Pyrenodesmia sp. 2 TL-2023]
MTSGLVYYNPGANHGLFSKLNLCSVYRTLCHRYFAETEEPQRVGIITGEIVERFRVAFNHIEVYMTLKAFLPSTPDYIKYRYDCKEPVSRNELRDWVLQEASLVPSTKLVTPEFSGGLLNEPQFFHSDEVKVSMLAQMHREQPEKESRTLIVSLPMDTQVASGTRSSHIHVTQKYVDGKMNISEGYDLFPDPRIPAAIALEFPDYSSKHLALMLLSKINWARQGHPFSRFVVTDYPQYEGTYETQPVRPILNISRAIWLDELSRLILSLLPHYDYIPAYEFSRIPRCLSTLRNNRFLIQRCPVWMRKLTGAPDSHGPYYIGASQVQNCGACRKRGINLPDYRDRTVAFEFDDGLYGQSLLIAMDARSLSIPPGVKTRVPYPAHYEGDRQIYVTHRDVDLDMMYREQKYWIIREFRGCSAEVMVAEFRRVRLASQLPRPLAFTDESQIVVENSKPMEVIIDILAGRFMGYLHRREQHLANLQLGA